MQPANSNDCYDKPQVEECNSNDEGASRRLLFIDDDETILEGYKFIFECEGFTVDVALDAESAMKLVAENPYSVIVMDYVLPETNGVDLAEKIQSIDDSINLIIISGQKGIEEEIKLRNIDISGIFLKPLKIETLVDHIVQLFD